MRWTRKTARRASSACLDPRQQLQRLAARRGRVDQQGQRHPRDIHRARSLIGARRRARRRAAGRQRSCRRRRSRSRRLESAPRQAPPQQQPPSPPRPVAAARPGAGSRRGAGPGRARPARGGRRRATTRSKRRRGRAGRAGLPCLKATRPSGSRPTRAVAARTCVAERVDAANAGGRELAGEEERASPSPHSTSSTRSGAGTTCRTAAASGVRGAMSIVAGSFL